MKAAAEKYNGLIFLEADSSKVGPVPLLWIATWLREFNVAVREPDYFCIASDPK